MAYQAPRIAYVKNNIVRVHHPEPIEPSTYLTANLSAAGTALTVKNNNGFANLDVLLFEGFGAKNAEIKKVNAAVTAGTSLTSSAVTFSHAISCGIYKLLFDKVEISGASTAGGSKTSIATIDLNVSGPFTDYIVSGSTYNYYFARFYNSLAASPYYGDYSDAVSASDFDPKNVGFIRRLAFGNVDQEYNAKYNDSNWIYDQIYLCELDVLKEKGHWSELSTLEYDLGNVTVGMERIALPDNIEDKYTNKSILGLRIGTRENMIYVDPSDFQWLMDGVAHSTLASGVSVSDTTVSLNDSRDFKDSDSINVAGTSYPYTSNTRASNLLSGFTAFSGTIASGTDVWQNITFGEPRRYTVRDGYIYFDIPPSSDWTGRNIWLDYVRGASRPDSDGDSVLFLDYPQIYITWIEMAIKKRRSNGELAPTDGVVVAYEREKARLAIRDRNQLGVRLVPDVPVVRRARPFSWMR